MNRQDFQKQWTDYLHRPVTADDRTLAELLATETALRESALRDAELHSLLLALGRVDASEETFVNGVVRKLMTEENDDAPMPPTDLPACANTNNDLITPPRRGADSPPPLPNAQPAPPPLPAPHFDRGLRPPVVAAVDRVESDLKGPSKRNAVPTVRNRHRWTARLSAVAVVVVWLIGLGLLFVVKTNEHPIADRPMSSEPEAEARRTQAMLPAAEVPQEGRAVDPTAVETSGPSQRSSEPMDVRRPEAPPLVIDHPPTPVTQVDQSPTAAPVYGRILDDTEATWESQASPRLTTGRIRLRAGTAKIEMADGATLIVLGPAEFDLHSANRISLTLGRLTATVPEAAVGFTVSTPSAQVIDLGTELVVDVDEAGATAVRVHRGQVEVSPARTGEVERRWRLAARQYKWISGDGGQDLDWRMHLTIDETSFSGVLNGQEFACVKAQEFIPVYTRMHQELEELRRLLMSARQSRSGERFQAEIDINSQRSTISDVNHYSRTYRRLNDQLRQVWMRAMQPNADRGGGALNGSFNINGEQFRIIGINSFDDLLKLQEEVRRRTGGFHPGPGNRDAEQRKGKTR